MSSRADWHARLYFDGAWHDGESVAPVFDKYTGEAIGTVHHASRAQVDAAVGAARRSFETSPLDGQRRYQLLQRVAALVDAHRDEFTARVVAEAGIPVTDAANEAVRAVQTFLTSAEEAKRLTGEMVPIEGAPGNAHRMAFTIRVPRGVVCAITSFNSPLNQVAHKVGPALASGNTVVIKPPQAAPFPAALLVELLLDAGVPPGHVALVQGRGADVGAWLAANQDVRFFSFTGSTDTGKQLQRSVGLRPVALELGSISAVVVCDDADLQRAAARCAASGFRRAGQVCTSAQRVFVDRRVFDAFSTRMADAARTLKAGDPRDGATDVGPMLSEAEARRAQAWIEEAVAAGARVLCGATRDGAVLHPTVLATPPLDSLLMTREVFAPVLSVVPFDTLDDVVRLVNAVPFGLAAGVFTRNIDTAMYLARRLHVGIVHVNEPSSSRVDMMPFGGAKDSGVGREGPKYAMQEMTEERLVTLSLENPA